MTHPQRAPNGDKFQRTLLWVLVTLLLSTLGVAGGPTVLGRALGSD